MSNFKIYEYRNSSIARLYSERPLIHMNPEYQRQSDVWPIEKRKFLIDTILNDYDIPKLYFHSFITPKKIDGVIYKYAVIDGRQRMESIFGFIENKFPLSEDFVFYEDKGVHAEGMTYSDLSVTYPELQMRINSFTLPILMVETDDIDRIEEMFLRLNEAVPLNAAEKRNAIGGPMARAITNMSIHCFFKNKVPFPNKRYQHKEVVAKLFLLLTNYEKIIDTKKIYLDNMVKYFKNNEQGSVINFEKSLNAILTEMEQIFIDKDPLLKTQSMLVLYFLLFLNKYNGNLEYQIYREKLLSFEDARIQNKIIAENDLSDAKFELLEFDQASLQGSNDASSIRYRYEVLKSWIQE